MRLILKVRQFINLIPVLCLSACASAPNAPGRWSLDGVSLYDSGYEKGTEIISVQQTTLRAVLSNFETGEVDVLDISQPTHLQRIARFPLGLSKGEELTSVAFHPCLDLFAAVIDAGTKPGRLVIHSASTGLLQGQVTVGYGPDAVVFSETGKLILVANEGEDFWYDRTKKEFFTPEGSISIVHLDNTGKIEKTTPLALADMTNHEGFVIAKGGRFLERAVDWDGDGKISKKLDFDGNGLIENKNISLGQFQGHEVFGSESKGEAKILIPIMSYSPAVLEPEYIAISPDESKAYVTLQEDDAVAVVDLIHEQVIRYYGLGISQHKSDAHNDGWVKFDQAFSALREPDGITTTSDGRYFITADEGDTDFDSPPDAINQVGSGGRSVSVFDAETGLIIGDTGNQVDEIAFANHVYPDRRSDKKGSEPEMLVSFDFDDIPLVAVDMERAGAVELISLKDPAHPKVVALGKIAGDEDKSPEGIAHFVVDNEHYLLTANEMNGTVECFKVSYSLND
jgi:DNA-binding beta-propeller fold protein YncE